MDGYTRCVYVLERYVVSCSFFKIIDQRMLGVLYRTREECRFSRSSFHSEGVIHRIQRGEDSYLMCSFLFFSM